MGCHICPCILILFPWVTKATFCSPYHVEVLQSSVIITNLIISGHYFRCGSNVYVCGPWAGALGPCKRKFGEIFKAFIIAFISKAFLYAKLPIH